jgi:peptidoglycan/xylan/chitin deacetylase (PgdA/CDA1 family)
MAIWQGLHASMTKIDHGIRRALRPAIAMNHSIVLCYHALSPTWEADLSTTPERFERQLELLVSRGYRGVSFTEAASAAPRGRVVAVTFDDAYRSVLELGLPILERLGLVGTVFAPTDFIGSERPMRWPGIDQWLDGTHERELMPMSWEELRTLAEAGWEIGSHTGSHPHLTQIDDDALSDELTRSKAACEDHLGKPCTSLAYPYGDVDARVVTGTASAGYLTAATLPTRQHEREALRWPRVGVYHRDDDVRFRLKVSPNIARLRRSVLWDSLDSLRRLGEPSLGLTGARRREK